MCLPVAPFKVEREWVHKGLQCAVTQAREGEHRCGYVRVPPGHPYYGAEMDSELVGALQVHGSITLAELEPCTEHEDGQGWWLGFDYGHAWDCGWDPNVDPDTLSAGARELHAIYVQCGLMAGIGPLGVRQHYTTHAEAVADVEALAEQLEVPAC